MTDTSSLKAFLLEKFLKYVAVDTTSNPFANAFPSSENQLVLAGMLVAELQALGLTDASADERGYVMATLPANTDKPLPVVGFVAHMDTSPDMNGSGIKPQIHHNYAGGDLVLNKKENIIMLSREFPVMQNYIGQTLITSDGTSLLGADNKAGIAEIMAALRYLSENPDLRHGTVRIAFTPDEEIGKGADHFDIERFGAAFAFTVDGGALGELQYENFNAAFARITIRGKGIHPGDAKDKMVNAALLGMEFSAMLPEQERPEYTEGYEGFYHLTSFAGTVEEASLEYIIRDHDNQLFQQRKNRVHRIAAMMNEKYGSKTVAVEMKDQYYNMHSKIADAMHIVSLAREAMESVSVKPMVIPIRGGTDGARLSYMGLPCPNLFTGGHNYHGRFEFIPLESMEKATRVIIRIIEMIPEKYG
ncbi:MAG: peptidase T [Bacteroidia bacterium]|nr:MAG: peptidase T [Bacteroidia bacterium]